jgi:hypothetical protein
MPRRLASLAFAIALLGAAASFVQAQIIFEPVQYEYDCNGQKYYYGGSDPRVHEYACSPVGGGGRWGRVNGYAFASGNIHTHREVVNEPTRVFTDALPFREAQFFGFTVNDARNEAYANVPRYFRKGDLLNAAIPVGDGSWVVPANAEPVRLVRTERGVRIESNRGAMPRPLMVIPKKPQKKAPPSDKVFANAR